jgi:hypothetical protein
MLFQQLSTFDVFTVGIVEFMELIEFAGGFTKPPKDCGINGYTCKYRDFINLYSELLPCLEENG